ncbi:hypothetical protein JZ751_028830 [Albula glossodonta]|uniref:Uncharacterized protein n=1 Tax=Albula glossodonta TaxID=121402 RepID=A0A8T2NAQ7_9TELE|nr:hypothetical protein JZ751_028830 [Albula glossodonta]
MICPRVWCVIRYGVMSLKEQNCGAHEASFRITSLITYSKSSLTYPGSVETRSWGGLGDRQEEDELEAGDITASSVPCDSGAFRDGPGLGLPTAGPTPVSAWHCLSASLPSCFSTSLAFASGWLCSAVPVSSLASAFLPSPSATRSTSPDPLPCARLKMSAANSRARAAACDWSGEAGEGTGWAESGRGSGEP